MSPKQDSLRDFDRVRRKAFIQRILALVTRQSLDLLSFEEVREQWLRHPERKPHLDEKLLSELEALYGAGPTGATTPEQVRRSAELFETYYFHAVPFRREVVQSTIERCRGQACLNARDARDATPGP